MMLVDNVVENFRTLKFISVVVYSVRFVMIGMRERLISNFGKGVIYIKMAVVSLFSCKFLFWCYGCF